MKTITKVYNIFEYEELSESAKQKARDWYQSASEHDEWWQSTYEDAAQIGLKIKSFDCGRANDIEGDLTESMEDVISLIIEHHGKDCGTYKLAEQYKKALENHLELVLDDDYPDAMDEFYSNNEEQFTKELCEEYLSILRKEYEYINSEEVITENILANSYTFDQFGSRMD